MMNINEVKIANKRFTHFHKPFTSLNELCKINDNELNILILLLKTIPHHCIIKKLKMAFCLHNLVATQEKF